MPFIRFSMFVRIRQYWQLLRESLWFVPGQMVLMALALGYGLVEFDAHTSWQGAKRFPLLFGVGADGSRGMLTAIASSMLTVAALIFSLTLSTITQVSSQYSPRVLRNFMRDRVNQVVMGYFISVFSYCLVVLGTIRSNDEGRFVPSTAVLVGLVLALGGVVALIFFIHHIAEALQTGTLVRHILTETTEAINALFPEQFGQPIEDESRAAQALRFLEEKHSWYSIPAHRTGYLQQIDTKGLLQWAIEHKAVVRMEYDVGAFIADGTPLFSVRPGMEVRGESKADWPQDLREFVSIGRHRNIEQDVGFGIQQLVDIALKALSPGVNDTTTAIMAVDYLGALGGQLARRPFPDRLRSDGQHLRVVVRRSDFDHYILLSFDLVRINAKGNHAVFRRILRALALIGSQALTKDRRSVVAEQAQLLMDYAQATLPTDYEKEQVRTLYDELKESWIQEPDSN